MTKTILGIGIGLALAYGAMIGQHYFELKGLLRHLWLLLSFTAWPCMGWGAYHFAAYRGYRGSGGVALMCLALLIFILVLREKSVPPTAHVIAVAFAAVFPIAIILAMPDQGKYFRENFGPPSKNPPKSNKPNG